MEVETDSPFVKYMLTFTVYFGKEHKELTLEDSVFMMLDKVRHIWAKRGRLKPKRPLITLA